MNNICKICSKSCESVFKLSKHITNFHRVKIKHYYDSYLAENNAGKCIYCGGSTFFHGIVKGYSSSCSKCKSHAAKDMRVRLKQDVLKFESFRAEVSKNQKNIWEKRQHDGTATEIYNKVSATLRIKNSAMTKEELSNKFGWQNRLTPEELEYWKKEVMLNTGCHLWWKTASAEEKAKVVKKRIATMIETEILLVEQSLNDPRDQSKYYQAVSYITEMNYHRYKKIIDPYSKRGKGYHLDHKFSVIPSEAVQLAAVRNQPWAVKAFAQYGIKPSAESQEIAITKEPRVLQYFIPSPELWKNSKVKISILKAILESIKDGTDEGATIFRHLTHNRVNWPEMAPIARTLRDRGFNI